MGDLNILANSHKGGCQAANGPGQDGAAGESTCNPRVGAEHSGSLETHICACPHVHVPDRAKPSKVHAPNSSSSATPEADTIPAVSWLLNLVPFFVCLKHVSIYNRSHH